MDSNTYQKPESDVQNETEFKRSIWWKIYFFFLTILSAFGMVSFLNAPGAGISEYISLILWVFATIGLFGFVFVKPIYKPEFWLQVFIAYVVFGFIYYFITDVDLTMGMSDTMLYISNSISLLISLPGYYGLYKFSKPNYPAWKNV